MSACATPAGTARYRARFAHLAPDHFRQRYGLWLSSIGVGTYAGAVDAATDEAYAAATRHAVRLGCNVIDTAIDYRQMASERVVGRVLAAMTAAGEVQRDEVVVCTKGGYIPDDGAPPEDRAADLEARFVATGIARPGEIVDQRHCLAPDYLSHQITASLANLGLDCIDVYYLHDPETQLAHVAPGEFMDRLRRAFARLEEEVAAGRIGFYGIAAWQGLRAGEQERHYLPLFKLAELAQAVGGPQHHFRFIQVPYNLGMPEAYTTRNQYVTRGGDASAQPVAAPLLAAAVQLGITAVAAAALRQTRVFGKIPASVKRVLEPLADDAQVALQFVRSTPGIATALVGMRQLAHVEQNLALAAVDPMPQTEFLRRFPGRR